MSNKFNLHIETPCSEKFESFSPTEKGGFCKSCNKEVIDFTQMNSAQISTYFQSKNKENTCGLFHNDQLNTYKHYPQKRKLKNMLSGLSLALISLFSLGKAQAQEVSTKNEGFDNQQKKFQSVLNKKNIEVKGTVLEDNLPLPGATVLLEGTSIGTSTDFDGNFIFPEKLKNGDVLIFSYVGMATKKIVITKDGSKLNLDLKVNLKTDTCIIMGKVAVKGRFESKKD